MMYNTCKHRMAMDLKTYLESRNITRREFAKMLGVSACTISNYICWKRKPTLEIGRMIEKITNKKVTIDDLLAYWIAKKDHG